MVFGRILASVGIGGTKVDTKIFDTYLTPGSYLRGTINLTGGAVEQTIEKIELSLETYAKQEGEEGNVQHEVCILRETVLGTLQVQAGQFLEIPFEISVPLDTPVNHVFNQNLPISIALRTHVHIAKAVDSGDRDPLWIIPHPAQEQVLEAMSRLGFYLHKIVCEVGQIAGARLPFFQEIEFLPGANFFGRLDEVEITFVMRERDMDVILEVDRKTRGIGFHAFLGSHDDQIRGFRVAYEELAQTDFERLISQTLLI